MSASSRSRRRRSRSPRGRARGPRGGRRRGRTAAIAPAAFSSTAERWPPAGRAGEHVAEGARRSFRRRRRAGSAGSQRGMPRSSRVELVLAHAAAVDLADEVRAGRRELVDAAGAVHDVRAPRVEPDERLGDRARDVRRVDADDLRARAGRVRQRPEHVEDRPRRRARGAPAPACFIAGMVRLREQEAEAELVDRLLDPLGRQRRASKPSASSTSAAPVADEAARLPCFATPAPAAAATSAAAVEMFHVLAPSPPVPAVSTRSSRFGLHAQHVLAHRLGAARDLVGRLALQPQRDEEPADLRLRRLAAP